MAFCPIKESLNATILTLIASIGIACIVIMPQQAYALTSDSLDDAIGPSQEEVDAFIAKINNEPVYLSKNEDGQSTTFDGVQRGYPTGTGQILVTDDKFSGLIPTGHAAIV